MANLKPCPFCGGQPTLEHHSEIKKPEECAEDCEECGCCDATPEFWAIAHRCKINNFDVAIDCGCFGTEAEAIEAWNTRAERTCKHERMFNLVERECDGKRYSWRDMDMPNYCPNCGARVVE